MLSVFILVVSTIALVYLLTLRDLFIIMLALLMTAAIFYIGYRFFRVF
jgi:hypothetical protein